MDLNLLVVLDALIREQNVSRAARDLGLSQSATSNALARLRLQLDDAVLVRRGRRMEPTARARALGPEVAHSLARLQRALSTSLEFRPSDAERRFTVALSDYVALVMLPTLLARLRQRAPGIQLAIVPYTRELGGRLREGNVDLVVAPNRTLDAALPRELLFEERSVTILAAGQLPPGSVLTLEEFVARDHILIAPFGGERSAVDAALAELGLARTIAIRFPHFLLAPHLVAGSAMIATLAARVAALMAKTLPLQLFPTPVPLPGFSISQAWDPSLGDDPGLRWLRAELRAVAEQLGEVPSAPSARPQRARRPARGKVVKRQAR